ncbi:MAG: 50S ribosomal protein L9 [bacterium]|nr:50S ribosomal protein L9 [bacterium]
MKIILLENIEKLGKKYEIKEVSEGYARNFLLPKKMAKVITPKILEWALEKEKEAQKAAENELKEIQDLAGKLDGLEIIFKVKTGEQNQLYESIDSQKIFQKIKEAGFPALKTSQLELKEKIKELGEYPIKIKLDHNLEAEIRIIVETEENKE